MSLKKEYDAIVLCCGASNPRDLKVPGRRSKGIYFAVIYFYEISHGDPSKAKGGIGIVSSVYNDSKEYWSNLEIKREGTLEGIIQQIATRQNRPVRTVRDTTRRNVPRLKYRLDDIEGD